MLLKKGKVIDYFHLEPPFNPVSDWLSLSVVVMVVVVCRVGAITRERRERGRVDR